MARSLRARTAFVVAGLLAGAACSPSQSGPATVRLQAFGDAEEIAGYRNVIAAFAQKHPEIEVVLDAVPKQGDHMAKLATAFAGGAPPDLFIVNYRRFGQFAYRGVLEPLGPRLAGSSLREDDFYSEPIEAFRVDGTVQCLPQNISSPVMYYNKALFERYEVAAPAADWTWDDFLATAKALTRDTDGDGRTDLYGFGTEPELPRLAPFVWQAGGEVVDDTENPTQTTLLGSEAVGAMRFFIDLRRVHKVSPSQKEAESEDYESRFQAGRLAMLMDTRKATPSLRAVPDLDFDVAPLPRGVKQASVLHSDAYCLAKSASDAVKDAAFAFVEFALGPEGATIVTRSGRTVPSLKSIATSAAFLDPSQKPASSQVWLDAIPSLRRFPNIESWNEIETRAAVRVEEWYYGTEPVEQLGIEIESGTHELFSRD